MSYITVTIGLSTIITILSFVYKYRKYIFGIFMKSKEKIQQKVLKNAIRLMNVSVNEVIKLKVMKESPEKVLELITEITGKLDRWLGDKAE